jgi:hypothetical protein
MHVRGATRGEQHAQEGGAHMGMIAANTGQTLMEQDNNGASSDQHAASHCSSACLSEWRARQHRSAP